MNEEEAIKYCRQIKDRDLWKLGYVYGGEAIETVLNLIQKQQEEIDEIAEELGNQYRNHEPCDLYGKMNCKKYKNCKECIKQYFEKKVEEDIWKKI